MVGTATDDLGRSHDQHHRCDADRELKARHRALWASGDYPAVAAELIPTLGPELVAAAGSAPASACSTSAPAPGTRPSRPRPRGDRHRVGPDPELFDVGRKIAASSGVELDWVQGDAEALPFPDDTSTW